MRRQAHILINQFNNIYINQQVQMADLFLNYVLIPFEGNINTGYPKGIKLYLKATKEKDKEYSKLDISVSNDKESRHHFLILAIKYG